MLLNLGQRSTIETLLEFKFQPTRTVVLSFGFDEEASGLQVSDDLIMQIQFRNGGLTTLIIRVLGN